MNEPKKNEITVYCPSCGKETFVINVDESGEGSHPDWGTYYWFGGLGKCSECGHEEWYSDSSA